MRFLMMNSGHLFLNLSTMSETATHALGSSAEQLALSVCGRPVTEFTIRGGQPPPRLRRAANGVRYVKYLLGQPKARREMRSLLAGLRFPESANAAAAWQEIDRRFPAIYDAMNYHLISSAGSGVLTPTLLGVIAGGREASEVDHARVAALLAGAEDVESADIITGAERIIDRIADHPHGAESFTHAEADAALEWIRSPAAGAAHGEFERYLRDHGHRAIKELELRQPEWRQDPLPVIRALQVSLRQRGSVRARPAPPDSTARSSRAVALLAAMARRAVRSREETKSGLVAVTARFKEAYRSLATLMVAEGLLPDPDAVFFLTHDELGRLARDLETLLAATALARREAFAHQEGYEFPDVFQGEPDRIDLDLVAAAGESAGVVRGAPVSRGRVTGVARIVRTLDEAAALQRGEILIAPVTDVGWTPYFSLIAGLVTDIGSAVSHGAVVAREYGLPAVVNTRCGWPGPRTRHSRRPASRSHAICVDIGRRTVNSVRPGTLWTAITPSWARTTADTIAKPNPVEPFWRERPVSARANRSNTSDCSIAGIPGPSSSTRITAASPSVDSATFTVVPGWVWSRALASRLATT
jgi:pyruvate,water dikinase